MFNEWLNKDLLSAIFYQFLNSICEIGLSEAIKKNIINKLHFYIDSSLSVSEWPIEHFLAINIGLSFEQIIKNKCKVYRPDIDKPKLFYATSKNPDQSLLNRTVENLLNQYDFYLEKFNSSLDMEEKNNPIKLFRLLELSDKCDCNLDESLKLKLTFAYFGLNLQVAKNGLPRGITMNAEKAAKFLNERLGTSYSATNIFELCLEHDFEAYIDSEKYKLFERIKDNGSRAVAEIEQGINSDIISFSFPYPYDGLIRLIKKYDDDGFSSTHQQTVKYLCNGGNINLTEAKLIKCLNRQLSLTEHIQNQDNLSRSVRNGEEIIITKEDILFREEELLKFVKKIQSKGIKTLTLSQLIKRWPDYSEENILELANQGHFGAYVKSYVERRTYHNLIDWLVKFPAQKEKFSNFIFELPYVLDKISGYERLATAKEVEIFPLCGTGSIKQLIEKGKISFLEHNNVFGFIKEDRQGIIANSYFLQYQTNIARPLIPSGYKDYFSKEDLYFFINQIELFENISTKKLTRSTPQTIKNNLTTKNESAATLGAKGAKVTNARHLTAKNTALEYAKTLWSQHPMMIKEDVAIRVSSHLIEKKILNGETPYSENKIKTWITPAVPSEKKKGGRPKKILLINIE